MTNTSSADTPPGGPHVYEHEGAGGIEVGGAARITISITVQPPDSDTTPSPAVAPAAL